MSAFEKLIKRLLCSSLKAKLLELKSRLESTNDEVEKLKIESMIEIVSRIYESECGG